MTQYLLLIQNNAKTEDHAGRVGPVLRGAKDSGLFRGGSALGDRIVVGDTESAQSTQHIGGYMRFDADDQAKLLELLKQHPVVLHGGSVELCEMPKS